MKFFLFFLLTLMTVASHAEIKWLKCTYNITRNDYEPGDRSGLTSYFGLVNETDLIEYNEDSKAFFTGDQNVLRASGDYFSYDYILEGLQRHRKSINRNTLEIQASIFTIRSRRMMAWKGECEKSDPPSSYRARQF